MKRSSLVAKQVFEKLYRVLPDFKKYADDFRRSVNVTEENNGYFAGCWIFEFEGIGYSYAYESHDGYTYHIRNEYMTRRFPGTIFSVE